MREIFAHGASEGKLTAAEVVDQIFDSGLGDLEPLWIAKLARVAALQRFRAHDTEFAISAFRVANPHLPYSGQFRRFHKLQFELLFAAGLYEEAEVILDSNSNLRHYYYKYLQCDLQNPAITSGTIVNERDWLKQFNAPLRAKGLSEVALQEGKSKPFDRLCLSENVQRVDKQPLVSVILTSFNAETDALQTSVRSILNQSWTNLELIIVDDASTDSSISLLEDLEQTDSRIKLIKLETNGGTYRAKNFGIELSSGKYITGQDADDWAHPQRIQRQVEILEEKFYVPAVQTFALTMDEDLVRTRLGYNPFVPCAITFMVRAHIAKEIGGYVEARKAADNEFKGRVEQFSGVLTEMIKDPLMFVRVLPQSLSRGDFRAGWQHPARRAFSSAYAQWHATAEDHQLRLTPDKRAPIAIPERFKPAHDKLQSLDVVFAGDWRQLGGPQYSMLNEIKALKGTGLNIGVMQFEATRFMSSATKRLCDPVQEMINGGLVSHVLPDEDLDIELLILRYPPILQFPPEIPVAASIHRLIILANQAPAERDGTDIRYIPQACADHAEELFGIRALWVPQGPTVREALNGLLDSEEIAQYDIGGIIDVDKWRTDRSYFRGIRPIIGRHSRDNHMKWPEASSVIEALYPSNGRMDVRVMGGATVPLRTLGSVHPSAHWLVFETNEIPVRTFLNSIDFFVYYQHSSAYDAFGRAILEALAAGCVVILPEHFRETFGSAAVYAEPDEVQDLVQYYYEDHYRFLDQASHAMDAVGKRFSYSSYARLIKGLLSENVEHNEGKWWKA